MSIQVIGAGFGRTGTMSLKVALEMLGYDKCYHMMEVVDHLDHLGFWSQAARGEAVPWDALFSGYQASVDWPSANYWREQLLHYPRAKVILTSREPERWYASVMNTIYPTSVEAKNSADPDTARFGKWVFETIWDRIFNGRMSDKAYCIKQFKAHEKAVIAEVPEQQLLKFQAADGWAPLCEFLGCAVPDAPYPNTNSTEDFLNNRGAKRGTEI